MLREKELDDHLRQFVTLRRVAVSIAPFISTIRSRVAIRVSALLFSAPHAAASYRRLSLSSSAASVRSAVPVLSFRCRSFNLSIIRSNDSSEPSTLATSATAPPAAAAEAFARAAPPREEADEATDLSPEMGGLPSSIVTTRGPLESPLVIEERSPVTGKDLSKLTCTPCSWHSSESSGARGHLAFRRQLPRHDF
jgi:hypothetical protein